MKTYKNSDIAKRFGVSPSTVGLWIKSALEGENNLSLMEHKPGKYRVLVSEHNQDEIVKLKNKGQKYTPSSFLKRIKPNNKLYKYFSKSQISEIITNLENYKEVPHKYTYFSQGSKAWHEYVDRSLQQDLVNTVTNTIELLDIGFGYFLSRLQRNQKFNILDVGVGDGQTIQTFLAKLMQSQALDQYLAIDLSQDMLNMTRNQFESGLGQDFNYSEYLRDINYDSLQDLTFYLSNKKDREFTTKNLVMCLETTIENQREYDRSLLNLKDSLGNDDILVMMHSIDNSEARNYFDLWNKESNRTQKVPDQLAWIPELLNIKSDFYTPRFIYDEVNKTRLIKLELNCDIILEFESADFNKELELTKGTEITMWRHSHHSLTDLITKLEKIELHTDYLLSSKNKAQVMLALRISP